MIWKSSKGLGPHSERRSADARQLGILAMVEDYAKTLLRELDYERESPQHRARLQEFC